MKYLLLIFSSFYCFSLISQYESIGPVFGAKSAEKQIRSCSFDSTFIYFTDTLQLPLFDEFSKNHFQQYEKDYLNPTLIPEKYYRMLSLTGDVISPNKKYTSQPTFRKKVNSSTFEIIQEPLPKDTLLIADLCQYPPIYVETVVYPPYFITDTIDFENPSDTLWIPEVEYFQDSATKFFVSIADPNAYWLDHKANHNYTNAHLPWSLGVVTFDGLDENGMPYFFGSNSNDYNDYLTSKPIFLGQNTAADSIYLSFLYQSQGLNDPTESNDSLVLEFFAPLLGQWERVWSTSGQELSDFKVFHKRIIEPKFLKDGFQFRLKNYGSVAGALDQFHIDYIHLRKFSGYQDTVFKDFAIVYPIKTLLHDYTQVPWDHYKNTTQNLMAKSFEVTVRNGSLAPFENNQDGSLTYNHNGTNEGNTTLIGQTLSGGNINYLPRSFYTSFHDISTNPSFEFDKTKTGNFQEFDITLNVSSLYPNYSQNDSTFFKQRFYDVYAYDDGSAEAAYGPEGVSNARLAYKFTPLEQDSLIGIKFKFVPSVVDVRNELFYLTIWGDNSGKPGEILYQDDFFNPRSPSYNYDDSLGFTNYYLKDTMKLNISGVFYVGWKQETIKRLNVGMDMNIDQSQKIFYSVDNENSWINTDFKGALLIRPIFATELNITLGTNKLSNELEQLVIYPNPSSGLFQVKSSNNIETTYLIYDLKGQLIIQSNEKIIDLSLHEPGIYFLKDTATSKTYKLIKN
jgi:hypothetical protein